MAKSALKFLTKHSLLSLDSGQYLDIPRYNPVSVTTNPSLIHKAAAKPEYWELVRNLIATYNQHSVAEILNQVLAQFCGAIAKQIPGEVSVELNANLAFDGCGSLRQAEEIVRLCCSQAISERILIKTPATWEGILACKAIGRKGTKCNMTLVFSLVQAILCSTAKAYVISPFVGRFTDFYKNQHATNNHGRSENNTSVPQKIDELDPGILLLEVVHKYYKRHHSETKVMAASFRNANQVLSAVGCDYITISPSLIELLRTLKQRVKNNASRLKANTTLGLDLCPINNRSSFYSTLGQNKAATNRLLDGIARFTKDSEALVQIIHKAKGQEQDATQL